MSVQEVSENFPLLLQNALSHAERGKNHEFSLSLV
jgi:hypothetical protein